MSGEIPLHSINRESSMQTVWKDKRGLVKERGEGGKKKKKDDSLFLVLVLLERL